eukprot:scaffold142212_cov23-Tisochrysis_lutea.AAC.2
MITTRLPEYFRVRSEAKLGATGTGCGSPPPSPPLASAVGFSRSFSEKTLRRFVPFLLSSVSTFLLNSGVFPLLN